MGTASNLPPAGWYADPSALRQLRWWDGERWTEHTTSLPAATPSATSESTHSPVESVRPEVIAAAPDLGRDLAENRPGAAVLAKAEELRREARSRGLLYRLLRSRADERAWRKGGEGEQIVARRLAKLGDEWRVLHAVPVGERGADIDHLVIGPAGVFSVNTKNHGDSKVWVSEKVLMVNGHRTDYFRNSRFEAERASRLLSTAVGAAVPVEPMIVLLAERLTMKSAPTDVHITGARRVHRHLRGRPTRLSASDVDALYAVARRERTWQPHLADGSATGLS